MFGTWVLPRRAYGDKGTRNRNNCDFINQEVYFKSDAALKVAEDLGVPRFMVSTLEASFPKPFRDTVYDGVTSNRYKILGKRNKCRCTDNAVPERFLDHRDEFGHSK